MCTILKGFIPALIFALMPATSSLLYAQSMSSPGSGAPSMSSGSGQQSMSGGMMSSAPKTAAKPDAVAVAPPRAPVGDPSKPTIIAVGKGQLALGICHAKVTGTGFVRTSVVNLNGKPLPTRFDNQDLILSGFCGQPGTASITVSNGTFWSPPVLVQVGAKNPKVSPAAARRFLEQAAFGPTPDEATHLQIVGRQAWLDEQFNMPQVSNYTSITANQGGLPTHFLADAVSNPDQLRQRVAFSLSQIFATSLDKLVWNGNMVSFQDMLLADSFSNFRQLMKDVTLSPAMGQFLDMANNSKANPANGSLPNENYARELMQLFSIGTNLLNQDGSERLDANGLPIPAYSQFTITEFARVYTGWTYSPHPGKPVQWGANISSGTLIPIAAQHDFGAKKLLNGYVSPAKISPEQDLDNALDNVFNHPNVGPFIGKQLIQHLVKSNPSPAYVSRVAAAFNDNGHNVRGDLRATIAAVLLDPEARANDEGDKGQPTDGHLQEPVIFVAGMVRAFGGEMTDHNYYGPILIRLGQSVFNPPSVFNYYQPTYRVASMTSNGAVNGGEFQIYTPNNAVDRVNLVGYLMFNESSNPLLSTGQGTNVDLSPFVPLVSNPTKLVDALDLTLTHGVMPPAMKAKLVKAVEADTGNPLHHVQTACYLILTSGFYNVWH
jgi:uncharacterized protein (DUF1800 family)